MFYSNIWQMMSRRILEGIRDSVEWETLGFRVIATALNGKELLEQTETLRPDLVISDIEKCRFWMDWKWRESCTRT